ncbi:c5ae61cb-f80d-4378-9c0b-1555f2fa0f76 [Thermothielavioides terrestris]|uniref:N-acetyltransferase domain-containing protein n=2 Tax=Thermothielavioides terrestris TaxID=2587410 RepID=G2R0H4_THETT|nr:uncharacterized protein THITE_2112794 [Thermothielavioides terrestris NRRL 8126]AEO65639.1 hypothetical protein THITE_2112794 [Thermothielavioides terrestris NRRL 8126]SPQ19104.1 c5ae61cb-f80d-4378-9c0b-1555f2fa0f76 [Thermothielavioides terrestris]
MSRALQQSSIRSFFQPRRQPEYAAPPSSAPPPPSSSTSSNSGPGISNGPPPAPPPPPPAEPPKLPVAAKPVTIPITLPPNGLPVLPSPPSLPRGATIEPLTEHHIPALRRINSLLLPVPYPDSFYAKALDPFASGLFSRAILWQDSDADTPKVIGGLICRLEPNPFVDTQGRPLPQPPQPTHPQKPADVPLNTPYHAIYIQSLALLSPYRSLGLAAAALEHIIASAALLPAAGSNIDARTVYAHVWTENEEGLRWYRARGFACAAEPVKGYYFKLRPDSAWVVTRHIGPSSVLASLPQAAVSAGPTASAPPSTTETRPASVLTAALNLPPLSAPSALSQPPAPPPASSSTPPSTLPQPRSNPPTATASPSPSPAPPSAKPPSASSSTLSFQNTRPETEWNDLPPDMVVGSGGSAGRANGNRSLTPNNNNNHRGANGSAGPSSGASSRSSSSARKRRERAYPAAAFGGS